MSETNVITKGNQSFYHYWHESLRRGGIYPSRLHQWPSESSMYYINGHYIEAFSLYGYGGQAKIISDKYLKRLLASVTGNPEIANHENHHARESWTFIMPNLSELRERFIEIINPDPLFRDDPDLSLDRIQFTAPYGIRKVRHPT